MISSRTVHASVSSPGLDRPGGVPVVLDALLQQRRHVGLPCFRVAEFGCLHVGDPVLAAVQQVSMAGDAPVPHGHLVAGTERPGEDRPVLLVERGAAQRSPLVGLFLERAVQAEAHVGAAAADLGPSEVGLLRAARDSSKSRSARTALSSQAIRRPPRSGGKCVSLRLDGGTDHVSHGGADSLVHPHRVLQFRVNLVGFVAGRHPVDGRLPVRRNDRRRGAGAGLRPADQPRAAAAGRARAARSCRCRWSSRRSGLPVALRPQIERDTEPHRRVTERIADQNLFGIHLVWRARPVAGPGDSADGEQHPEADQVAASVPFEPWRCVLDHEPQHFGVTGRSRGLQCLGVVVGGLRGP